MLSAFSFLVAGVPVKVCVVGPVSLLLTSPSAAWSMIVVPTPQYVSRTYPAGGMPVYRKLDILNRRGAVHFL